MIPISPAATTAAADTEPLSADSVADFLKMDFTNRGATPDQSTTFTWSESEEDLTSQLVAADEIMAAAQGG